ncbi:hypothetical protein NMG60_11020844 [Bertholletia excelsa]
MAETVFSDLPQDCVSTILSFTSPPDACTSSLASSTLRSLADSDAVWEKFLPSDHEHIVLRSVTPFKFSSKKELYFCLCNPLLIDGGNKSFRLEKLTGRKSYMLSARELSIRWSEDPMYWIWKPEPASRFGEVAVLRMVWWLEIHGTIRTQMLSPNTAYGAYLVMKISESAYGLDSMPSELSVRVGNVGRNVYTGTAYLCPRDSKKQLLESLVYLNRKEMLNRRLNQGEGTRVPIEREDGWMEIELGKFFNGEGDEDVKISVGEVKSNHFKGGLVVEGIDVRPSQWPSSQDVYFTEECDSRS